jgi:hypothetical protein
MFLSPNPPGDLLNRYFASCALAVPMPYGGRLSDRSHLCQACRMLPFGPDSNLRSPWMLDVGADFIFEDFQSLRRSAEMEKYCRLG